jgi:hypothetical protein
MLTSLAIINCSTISDADVRRYAAAQNLQVQREFGAAWDRYATVFFSPKGATLPPGTWKIYIYDEPRNAGDAGALGHHALVRGTLIPIGYVFARLSQRSRETWTEITSHEVLETIADPWVNLSAMKGADIYPLEICDPVQGQDYEVDGVRLANFVTPNWFVEGMTGPFDHLHKLRRPFEVAPGGYAEVLRVTNGKLASQSVYGAKLAAWRKASRPWSRRDSRCRKVGIVHEKESKSDARPAARARR